MSIQEHNLRPATSTLVDLLRLRADSTPAAPVFTLLRDGERDEESLSFSDLDRRARAIAAELQRMGAGGQRALLLYPFGLDYIAAFFGALYAGVVAVPVYPPDPDRLDRSLPRLRAIAKDAQATIVLTTEAIEGFIEPFVDQLPELAALRILTTDTISDLAAAAWQDGFASLDSLAFLQYTSGSTSSPKGVMLTHRNLLHNEESCHRSGGTDSDSVIFSWLPMYHDMGLISGVLYPIYSGVRCVLMPPQLFLQKPLRWLAAITRYRVTHSGGPNFAFDLCSRKVTPEERAGLDLRSWRYAFNGAEPVRRDTMERFARHFEVCGFRRESLRPLYGLAEATLMVTGGQAGMPAPTLSIEAEALAANRVFVVDDDAPGARHLVGCGSTWLDQEVVIVDPATHAACRPGEIGEIWVRGGSVAVGYWNRPEETEATFGAVRSDDGSGPYLRTSDLGFLREGELFVTGRLNDVLVVRGRNHYPQDIERTVEESHPGFRKGCGAAFPIVDGEMVRLGVVFEVQRNQPAADLPAMARAARRAVTQEHGLAIAALALVLPGRIPKTSSGKIQRAACREAYFERRLDAVYEDPSDSQRRGRDAEAGIAPANAASFLLEELSRRTEVPADSIDLSCSLAELGLDSLAMLELRLEFEELLGRELGDEELQSPVAALLALLERPSVAPARAEAASEFEIVWDIERESPALHRHLARTEPWLLPALDKMRLEVPVPPTNDSFDVPEMFRPPGHFRAFYVRGPGQSVLALKGADLRCEDQRGLLQMLQSRQFERFAKFSVTNALEYFLLQERKIPGALLLSEALAEAKRAAEVQQGFLDRFGAAGPLPVPLLILRWSQEQVNRFRTSLLPLLSGYPLSIAEQELEGGLACYVYYFPCAPFPRVSHFAGALAQESVRTGIASVPNTRLIYSTLKHNLDPARLVDSWIELVARMLVVGYFPSDTHHFKNGQCIEPQNVLLHGALADLDSVTPIRSLSSDREFYAAFLAMLNLLANTTRVFLMAENNGTTAAPSPFPAQFPKPDFLDILTVVHVWERLKAHLLRLGSDFPGELDPRLHELVSSNLSFPVLFDKVLFALHYAGPEIPESILHMLNITDVYGDPGGAAHSPLQKLPYDATLHIDSAALITIPRAFLNKLQLPAARFIQDVLKGDAVLLNVYDTFLGRIGLIVLPLEDAAVFDRPRTLEGVRKGLAKAAQLGAKTVSLTGLIPSATDYGRALPPAGDVRVTTGHATTLAGFLMMVERILKEAGRSLDGEDVALVGLGSIGTGIVAPMLANMPHPRRLRLCELPARREHVERLREEILLSGYEGELELNILAGGAVPERLYDATLFLSATSTPNVLDVDRLRPGTLIVDDSAPHCFDPRRAIRRFQQQRDILFTEAGAIRSGRPILEITDLAFSTGWDQKVRTALRLLHPEEDTIMGCVFSSLFTHRFDDVPATVGTPTPHDVAQHYRKLKEMGFEGSRLYCEDHFLDAGLIEMFRRDYAARS